MSERICEDPDRKSAMWWRTPHNPTAYDDDWSDQPNQSWFHRWILGLAVPLLIVSIGGWGVLTGSMTGKNWHLFGTNARICGVAWLAAGVFLHCHYYWGDLYADAWGAVLGKIAAMVLFIGAILSLFVRLFLLANHG